MKEIDSLVERARKYVRSARILLLGEDHESSVSRSYYAMFYCAEAALLTKGLSFSSHKGVISAFGQYFVKTRLLPKDMGRELNRAYQKRQLGDYEYTCIISKKEAEEILKSAEEFVGKVARYLKDSGYLSGKSKWS